MLECLVFGRRAAHYINSVKDPKAIQADVKVDGIPTRPRAVLDYAGLRHKTRDLMSDYCGVVRKRTGLTFALEQMSSVVFQLAEVYDDCNEYLEALNIAVVAKAILEAALARPESIGSHYMENDSDQ